MADPTDAPNFNASEVHPLKPLRPSMQAMLRMGTMGSALDLTPQEREAYSAITGHYPKPGDTATVFLLLYGTKNPSPKDRGLAQ